MNTATTFAIGQKVERKGKFYIVVEANFEAKPDSGYTGDLIGVRRINKKTGNAWQAPHYFPASEVKAA